VSGHHSKEEPKPEDLGTPDRTKAPATRGRDRARTRRLLIEAARRRFALEGYAATTVRQIARDAVVNAALINRYFGSKEGLFEECLASAARLWSESVGEAFGLTRVAEGISRHATGTASEGGLPDVLLLLLRPSRDERAEQMRTNMLRTYGERIASAAGWTPGHPEADDLLLRAQLVLAVGIGIAVLSASGGLKPLSSASSAELVGPLRELVGAVLGEGLDRG
jgi:AcrR family transcriptional regulator